MSKKIIYVGLIVIFLVSCRTYSRPDGSSGFLPMKNDHNSQRYWGSKGYTINPDTINQSW